MTFLETELLVQRRNEIASLMSGLNSSLDLAVAAVGLFADYGRARHEALGHDPYREPEKEEERFRLVRIYQARSTIGAYAVREEVGLIWQYLKKMSAINETPAIAEAAGRAAAEVGAILDREHRNSDAHPEDRITSGIKPAALDTINIQGEVLVLRTIDGEYLRSTGRDGQQLALHLHPDTIRRLHSAILPVHKEVEEFWRSAFG